MNRLSPLPASFYRPSVLQVARSLLGQFVVREIEGGRLVGRIVETEAYGGLVDPASHSFRGCTPRCRTMFGPAGRAYVYFTYGNHHCLNVIAGARALAGAVLIRAVEPIAGLEVMRRARAARTSTRRMKDRLEAGQADRELANGPGKLTAALGVDLDLDDHDLTRADRLWLARGKRMARVVWTPRIGLGTSPAAGWLWRCVEAASPHAGRVPGSWPRAPRPRPARVPANGGRRSAPGAAGHPGN